MNNGNTALSETSDNLDRYYSSLEESSLAALWTRLKGLVPSEPKAIAQPHQWKFEQLLPKLLEAGGMISAQEAERRVLILENPALPGQSKITDTLYSGVQLLLPGEVAPAHRHTQSALRFILKGQGAYTSVDGEKAEMHPGDFIITPHWTWHDHGHDGSEPVVWIDGLDVPLVNFLRAGFREEHDTERHEVKRPFGDALARYGMGLLPIDCAPRGTSPIFSYPYARTREALDIVSRSSDIDAHQGIRLRYVNPTNGDWAIPTIATSMTLLPKGFRTQAYRSTDGVVLTLTEGTARVVIGGQTFNAVAKDILVVPGWTDWTISADNEDVVFFSYSDRPVHEKLGLWKERRG